MPKTIVFYTTYFYPEDTAIGFYTTQVADYLQKKGFQVVVLTGFPHYPQWEIYDNYKTRENYTTDTYNGIKIIRYKQFVPQKVTFVSRIKMMLSFTKGFMANSRQINNADLVITIIPYTLAIFPGHLLARKKKAKHWVHIQDFEFDLAFETGILSKKNLFSAFFKYIVLQVERFLLNKADIISSISNSMLQKAQQKTIDKPLFFFPNWISNAQVSVNNSKIHSYISKNKFSILYSGNVGEKQNWDLLVDLCQLINNESGIEIVIVGNGAYLLTLKERLQKFNFVIFKPIVPLEQLGQLLASVNVHFLFQKTDVVDSVMPSKILGMMASGKPSIITGHKDSETATIFNQNLLGYFLPQSNPEVILEKINILRNDILLANQMGENAKKYVFENFSEEVILDKFTQKINAVLNE